MSNNQQHMFTLIHAKTTKEYKQPYLQDISYEFRLLGTHNENITYYTLLKYFKSNEYWIPSFTTEHQFRQLIMTSSTSTTLALPPPPILGTSIISGAGPGARPTTSVRSATAPHSNNILEEKYKEMYRRYNSKTLPDEYNLCIPKPQRIKRCNPCRIEFDDYLKHIDNNEHQISITNRLYHNNHLHNMIKYTHEGFLNRRHSLMSNIQNDNDNLKSLYHQKQQFIKHQYQGNHHKKCTPANVNDNDDNDNDNDNDNDEDNSCIKKSSSTYTTTNNNNTGIHKTSNTQPYNINKFTHIRYDSRENPRKSEYNIFEKHSSHNLDSYNKSKSSEIQKQSNKPDKNNNIISPHYGKEPQQPKDHTIEEKNTNKNGFTFYNKALKSFYQNFDASKIRPVSPSSCNYSHNNPNVMEKSENAYYQEQNLEFSNDEIMKKRGRIPVLNESKSISNFNNLTSIPVITKKVEKKLQGKKKSAKRINEENNKMKGANEVKSLVNSSKIKQVYYVKKKENKDGENENLKPMAKNEMNKENEKNNHDHILDKFLKNLRNTTIKTKTDIELPFKPRLKRKEISTEPEYELDNDFTIVVKKVKLSNKDTPIATTTMTTTTACDMKSINSPKEPTVNLSINLGLSGILTSLKEFKENLNSKLKVLISSCTKKR